MFRYTSLYRATAIFSVAGFLLLGIGFLQPFSFTDKANAESSSVDISATVASTLGISTDINKVDLDITTDDYENLVTGDVTVNVSTSNAYGYTLSVSAEGSETALVNKDNNNLKIPTLSNETTSTTWASDNDLNNTWGFTHNNTDILTANTYLPMVASNTDGDTTIKSTSEPKNSSETKVTFATKIDKTQLSGDYSNKIIFSAVANSKPPTLDDITYMQDVYTYSDIDLCGNSTEWTTENNKEYILKDSRDNEEYVIRKLKDSNCWMASNLRLRGENLASGVSTTLDSTNTDLTSGSTFILPSSATWTSTSTTYKGLIYSGNTNAKIGSSKTAAVSSTQAQARGTYYTWCTATADCNSAAAKGGPTQPNSICPKGWKLPNGDGASTDTNQFYKLYNSYAGSSQYADFMSAYNYYYGNGAQYYLAGSWYTDGYVGGSDTYGYWWSNAPHPSYATLAWPMYADTSSVYPGYGNDRSAGFSVRCVLASS